MRIALVAFLSALSTAVASASSEPTAEDYSVWRAVLEHAASGVGSGTIYVWQKVERFEVYDYGAMKGFSASMKLLTKELIAAFNRRNWDRRNSLVLQTIVGVPKKVELFGERKMIERFGRVLNPGWRINPREFGDGSLVTRISLPGYSRDGQKAFVFAALCRLEHCEQSYFILRRQREDSWRVAEEKAWWRWDSPDYTSDR